MTNRRNLNTSDRLTETKRIRALLSAPRPRQNAAWVSEDVRESMDKLYPVHITNETIQILKGTHQTQTATFANLPQEVILLITEQLDWADNVSLGLTCKHVAATAQAARESFANVDAKQKSDRRGKRAAGSANSDDTAKQAQDRKTFLKPPTKFVRLDILRQLDNFFPLAQYRLCFGCIKYVPRARVGGWGGDNKFLTKADGDNEEAHELGPRCAWCVARDDLELHATRAELNSLKQLVARI